MAQNVYLAAGLRSPIGTFGGSLKPLRATEFGTAVGAALFEQTGVRPADVERVIGGMVLQDMTESNPARIVALRLGIPDKVPAFTINMQCCSSMVALIQAAQMVALGEADCVMAMGLESMSNAPHMVPGSRWGHRLGHGEFIDTLRECTLAGSRMWDDPWYMIDVAEHHATADGVSREEMDEYAVVSHKRALAAMDAGRLDDEIVPIDVPTRRGGTVRFERDETPRSDINIETLGALPPVKEGGVITAGNAASINDGAAVALVCSEQGLAKLGLDPLARIMMPGTAMVGCDPHFMGYSCVDALNASLDAAELSVDDLDLIECNEGFAVQLVACQSMGGWSSERLNVDGGAVATGHPVGMSGLRITLHLAHALRQRDLKLGGATVPAGSGLGAAVLLERG
ncbi:MAG: thiolase family protein [Alphaproteobacteria bacterium]|nr:thiolase family protein [Alphaproteobacteria bacterium]MDP6872762.1 thiolase family protein [Alphaproteobacteria bacterium]